jgi:hypothetical protein
MSKENNKYKEVGQKAFDGVYIRGMNSDQIKESFNTKERVLGMTPSQALVNEFRDKINDPEKGERFLNKLNHWIDRSEVKKAEGEMKAITPWLQTVVEKTLMDVDQKNFNEGKESMIDWSVDRNKNNYYSMVSNMETKWQAVSLLGARMVDVNTRNLGESKLVDGKLLTDFKDTFGVIGDDLYDIVSGVDALVRTKTAKVAVPVISALTILTGCVETVKTPVANPTPTLEASPVSGTGEFSVLFTPNSLQNLDAEAKAIVSKNLELISQECNRDLPGRMMPGSEKYLFARNKSNETFIWGFCDVASADAPVKTIVSMFDWTAGPSGETQKIYQDLVAFDDGTMGYVDSNGISHAILKINNDNMIEVYDINERVVAEQVMTPEAIGFFDGVKNVSGNFEPTATVTEVAKKTYDIDMEKFFNPAPSYEYMVAHPDEYVEAPDLLSDVEAFKDWYYNKYIPALCEGNEYRMETNVYMGSLARGLGNFQYVAMDQIARPLIDKMPIAFFMHEGIFFPILAFTVDSNGNKGTYSVILHPKTETSWLEGFESIKNLYEERKINYILGEISDGPGMFDAEITKKFLETGFNWSDFGKNTGFSIGLGGISTSE